MSVFRSGSRYGCFGTVGLFEVFGSLKSNLVVSLSVSSRECMTCCIAAMSIQFIAPPGVVDCLAWFDYVVSMPGCQGFSLAVIVQYYWRLWMKNISINDGEFRCDVWEKVFNDVYMSNENIIITKNGMPLVTIMNPSNIPRKEINDALLAGMKDEEIYCE